MSEQDQIEELPAQEKEKPPIPRDVSCVAYICTGGYIRYCTTGEGRELPADFQEWHRPMNAKTKSA